MFFVIFSAFLTILTIPIKLTFKGFCSFKDKKVFFSCNIFKVFNLLSGFLDFANNRIILSLKKDKTKALKYKDMLPDEVKTDVIYHFDTINIQSATLLGGEFDEYKAFFCVFINVANRIVYHVLKERKPYLKFKNDVFLLDESSPSGAITKFEVVTNLVAVIEILVKKIYGGIYNYVKGKIKQQNS